MWNSGFCHNLPPIYIGNMSIEDDKDIVIKGISMPGIEQVQAYFHTTTT